MSTTLFRLTLIVSLWFAGALASPLRAEDDPVPKTVEGGSHKVKNGGKEIGSGFRGIGRGVKDVFTGQRSKEDFEKAKDIGEGAKDVGLGTAGVGRGVGRGIRDGVKGEGASEAGDAPPPRQYEENRLQEEQLTE